MTERRAADASVHAKLVEEPRDLAELREVLRGANGSLRSAQRGVGDEILLRIRSSPDAVGDWRVGTQASDWVLASPSAVLPGAHASPEAVDSALAELGGIDVSRLEVTDALSLVVVMSDGRWLEVEGYVDDPNERDDDPPYWEVLSPADELIRAGPGPIWVRGTERVSTAVETARVALDQLAVEQLLGLWSGVTAELRRRGVVRGTATALGDIAEELVRRHYGGFRGSYAQAGWDVLSDAGERIEVKAFQLRRESKRLPTLTVREGEFDALVVVLFDEGLVVRSAWHVPRETLAQHGSGAWSKDGLRRLSLRRVLDDPTVSTLKIG